MGISPNHPAIIQAIQRGLISAPVERGAFLTAPPADCSEKAFQASVVALAKALNWKCFHPFDSRKSESGFPDLTMVHDYRLIFAELKSETGRFSSEQNDWLEALAKVKSIEVHRWFPSDWEQVVFELRGTTEPSAVTAAIAMPRVVFDWQQAMRAEVKDGTDAEKRIVEKGLAKLKEFCSRFTGKKWPEEEPTNE